MSYRHCLVLCAVLICLSCIDIAQSGPKRMFPLTRFTCIGKPSGYYADVDTGCQVYHMCDGMGRQFSYKCPNMTLFQQRMLICDHWYMVNCSMSEKDYDANLLIGQRDKPFVSDDEMRLRTPRPDILAVPPYNPYYDVLRVDNKLDEVEDNDLDTKQTQNHIRSDENHRRHDNFAPRVDDKATSEETKRNFKPSHSSKSSKNGIPRRTAPPVNLLPPLPPISESVSEEDYDVDTHSEAPVFKFLKHFNPNDDDDNEHEDHKTAISNSEIRSLNAQLPAGPVSTEEDRNGRKFKNFDNKLNTLQSDKAFFENSRFNSVNIKPRPSTESPFIPAQKKSNVAEPALVLQPPKTKSEPIPSTTVGPPIYYEWRWAVPAFDLVPPTESNETNVTNLQREKTIDITEGKNPFSSVTRPEPITTTPEPSHVEYNISSYFVPDYVFPLDKGHPGYDNEDAQTSFQVNVPRPGRASFGENPDCPQCHPAYLRPGTCEPCIVER